MGKSPVVRFPESEWAVSMGFDGNMTSDVIYRRRPLTHHTLYRNIYFSIISYLTAYIVKLYPKKRGAAHWDMHHYYSLWLSIMVPVGGRVPPKPILHWQQLLVFQLSGPATLATLALVRPPVPTPTRPSHPGTLPPPELPPAKWVHIDKTVNVKEMEKQPAYTMIVSSQKRYISTYLCL
jgi:hypothetical protein